MAKFKITQLIQERVDALHLLLLLYPARTSHEIAEALGWHCSVVEGTISFIRKNGRHLGWTIPHVSKSRKEGIYFVASFTRDGEIEHSEMDVKNMRQGTVASVSRWLSQAKNQKEAILAVAKNVRNLDVKRRINSWEPFHDEFIQQTSALLEELREAA